MTPMEQQLIVTLTESVNKLSDRVQDLEKTINQGRGAFKFFLYLLTIVGTAAGLVRIFWR